MESGAKVRVNSRSRLEIQGSTLSFHDVSYRVNVGPPFRKVEKTILDQCSGVCDYGSVNAIMGPSGSGKSSLLDILAGRKRKDGLSGLVLVDGQDQPSDFKLMSGYVTQDDAIMGTLTVRENLMFSASLRLPGHVTKAEREDLVQSVIDELSLTKCSETRIGDGLMRGVSGGERKRTAIGMELIIRPKVLFLDEPTTGLDSSTARMVMTLLQRLSRKGSTIIFSIHQPRFGIYKLCDKMMLLGNGQTIYSGPASEGLDFFKEIGYECESHYNPADFYLDVINGDIAKTTNLEDDGMEAYEKVAGNATWDSEGPSKGRTMWLAAKYKESHWNSDLQNQLGEIHSASGDHSRQPVLEKRALEYNSSLSRQMSVLSMRTAKNIIRNPRYLFLQFIVTNFFALVAGVVYYQLADDCSGLQNRYGAFFFMTQNQMFSNMAVRDLFIQSRALFMHENISGYYRVSSYFLSQVICDIIPMRIIPGTTFAILTYFMMGLQLDAGKFFYFLLVLQIVSLAICALVFFISASVRSPELANVILPLILILMMLFGGFIVNIDSLGDWISWVKYLSMFRWCLAALAINEVGGVIYYDSAGTPCPQTGSQFLEIQGIPYGSQLDMWIPVIANIGFFVGFLILTYIQLIRMDKYR